MPDPESEGEAGSFLFDPVESWPPVSGFLSFASACGATPEAARDEEAGSFFFFSAVSEAGCEGTSVPEELRELDEAT